MAQDVIPDGRFDIIERAKKDLFEKTNIIASIEVRSIPEQYVDNFLFRCWQMGWLKQYERKIEMTDEGLKNKCSEISGTPFDYFKAGYELAKSVDNKE